MAFQAAGTLTDPPNLAISVKAATVSTCSSRSVAEVIL
jgi:hypothetical protein